MRSEILILPDIHGRDFWIRPTALDRFDHIVFLGDYLDPYQSEGISAEMAISNFCEILRFKDKYPDLVTLLIGNHDAHYWWKIDDGVRSIAEYDLMIHATFKYYRELFQLVYTREICGMKYIFSHAGVMKKWLHINSIDGMNIGDLNSLLDKPTIGILDQISEYRGGYAQYPSPIWADMWDYNESDFMSNVYQIFGHTQNTEPTIMRNWACLDCHKPFVLNTETGELKEWHYNESTNHK